MENVIHYIYIGNNQKQYLKTFKNEIQQNNRISATNQKLWGDAEIKDLLEINFPKHFLKAYKKIRPYAYKADFARLAILFVHGGVYLDLGIKLLAHPKFKQDLVLFYDHPVKELSGIDGIQNSFIFAKKRNEFLYYALEQITNQILMGDYGRSNLDITGPAALYRSVEGFGLCKKHIHNFYKKEPHQYYYSVDGVHIAKFKDQEKNHKLKTSYGTMAYYALAWDNKLVFNTE